MSLWAVSYVVLWILVGLLLLGVTGLYRQAGILLLRAGPQDAFEMADQGPEIGTVFKRALTDVKGRSIPLGTGLDAMLIFVSPGCGACDRLIPAISTFGRHHPVVVVSSGDQEASEQYLEDIGTKSRVTVVSAPGLADEHHITYPPYAVRLDGAGVVLGGGVVNTLEHLERLESRTNRLVLGANGRSAEPVAFNDGLMNLMTSKSATNGLEEMGQL